MNRFALILGLGLACAATTVAAEGVQQLVERCAACHGKDGAKPIAPDYPYLAGQYADYLEHALRDYKAGRRKNPVMSAQATQLSDQDIEALAEYFDRVAGPLYTPTEVGNTH